jgi:hypothetical protein
MQVVKGGQNLYPMPGGVTAPPSPGSYKYGGVALQFRVWTTGRQPVTVKKLTGRKPKLWPQNRLSGIDLRNENINKCKIINWKERGKKQT